MICTLEDFDIPLVVSLGEDVEWIDEFEWSPVPQNVRLTLDGAALVETLSPNSATQPITLKVGWVTRTVKNQLIQLRDRTTQSNMELTLCDGTVKTDVLFAYHLGPPVVIVPHLTMPDYTVHAATIEWFAVTLKLFDAS